MKDLIKQYLDSGISRRRFLSGLGGVGLSAAAAESMAGSLAPFMPQQSGTDTPWLQPMTGPGGALLVAQLKAAGIRHVFVNPHGASGTFFDALVDEPDIHIIKALEEGALGAMADGYAKASGKPAFAMVDAAGVPAFMGMLVISSVDQVPVILSTDEDAIPNVANSITKWQWVAEQAGTIPEVTRRALKFATTSPAGPVFLVITAAAFRGTAQADIMDQAKFNVSMKLRPESALVEQAAGLLLDAKNPALYIGDEVTRCGAEKEALERGGVARADDNEIGLPANRRFEDPGRRRLRAHDRLDGARERLRQPPLGLVEERLARPLDERLPPGDAALKLGRGKVDRHFVGTRVDEPADERDGLERGGRPVDTDEDLHGWLRLTESERSGRGRQRSPVNILPENRPPPPRPPIRLSTLSTPPPAPRGPAAERRSRRAFAGGCR